jgi:putative phosphoribosyl transferase
MFADRADAGRHLAGRLMHLKDERPVVLGLPRGGVVVAAEVARALEAPLDVLVVRKIGAPHQPELALGAVSDAAGMRLVLNEPLIRAVGVDRNYIERATREQYEEVLRRLAMYRGDRPAVPIDGRSVIVVDDGIATGATVQAALRALAQASPKKRVLAVPVAPPEALRELAADVDEIVVVEAPPSFRAVGQYYQHFDQTTDDEVIELLRQ